LINNQIYKLEKNELEAFKKHGGNLDNEYFYARKNG